jgi:hypothetical protein
LDELSFWEQSNAVMAEIFSSPDAQEGSTAFLEKRQPHWASWRPWKLAKFASSSTLGKIERFRAMTAKPFATLFYADD